MISFYRGRKEVGKERIEYLLRWIEYVDQTQLRARSARFDISMELGCNILLVDGTWTAT